jgi:hypothetical protein
MTYRFVLTRFVGCDDPYTTFIGVYTSRQKAVNKMLKVVKKEYNKWCLEKDRRNDYVTFMFPNKKFNKLTWDDFKINFKQHMRKYDGYGGLFGMTYEIHEMIIDE